MTDMAAVAGWNEAHVEERYSAREVLEQYIGEDSKLMLNLQTVTEELGKDIKSLLSHAIGCMFGRYSLDFEGLSYTGEKWGIANYSSFIPDVDNVIPIGRFRPLMMVSSMRCLRTQRIS